MNELSFNDPQLAALETQLAALTLRVTPREQQRLLYECGCAAERAKSKVVVRRWRIVASCLALIVAMVIAPNVLPQQAMRPEPDALQMVRPQVTVPLDAWQLSGTETTASTDEIARLAQNDPGLRSLSVGALTRRAIEQ
jgi:hypothetical protein